MTRHFLLAVFAALAVSALAALAPAPSALAASALTDDMPEPDAGSVTGAPLVATPKFIPTDKIIPISEVKPGMRGECRTVVRGREIVTFPVEVIDVVQGLGSPRNLIMIRASGPLIEATGGLAAGMSGSPVYINGRLAGAFGYGWNLSRHDIGLATSIEDMIAVWDNPERVPSFAPAPLIPDAPASPDAEPVPASGDEIVTVEGAGDFRRLTPPLFVGGVSPRFAEMMGRELGAEVMPFAASGPVGAGDRSKRAKYGATLRPGAAIGASLIWGDVEMSAIGTLSAVARDGRFVAFAHPFLGTGFTSAALSEAEITRVIPSLATPFKFGRTGDMIGIITQDRPEGIGGRMGTFAPAASCSVRVLDADSGRRYLRRFQTVQDPFMIANLATTAAAGVIEGVWGRKGPGSARVTMTFSGGALPDGWSRSDIFVSETDIAAELLKDFKTLASAFALNQFQELRPFGMDIDVELTADPRVVYIEDVKLPGGPFAPGQAISVDVTLRPWRKPPEVKSYSVTVPKNASGVCQLMARGGGIAEENAEYMEQRWRAISSLPILLRELGAKESNDQMVIEIRGQEALDDLIKKAQAGDPSAMMNPKLKSEQREERIKEGSLKIIRANYYVDGMIQRLIQVEGSAQEDGAAQADQAKKPVPPLDPPGAHLSGEADAAGEPGLGLDDDDGGDEE